MPFFPFVARLETGSREKSPQIAAQPQYLILNAWSGPVPITFKDSFSFVNLNVGSLVFPCQIVGLARDTHRQKQGLLSCRFVIIHV